ncbi:MAG: hypothetical protein LBP59_08110, partial [Planctomycetaceae bacterium]|nr:hypothetical protein [Planctomycetaceae bacterium]
MRNFILVTFFNFVLLITFSQQILFAADCPPNCSHQLTNVTLSVTPTLMEVKDNGDQVYCLAVSGSCDAPPEHAEML